MGHLYNYNMICLLSILLVGALAQGPPPGPTITITDQTAAKGGALSFTFTVESERNKLDASKVHLAKATEDHKFSDARFTVTAVADSDKKLTATVTGSNLTCEDQAGYLAYYDKIPTPPSEEPTEE